MKKVFALMMAVMMVLSLAACGGGAAPAESKTEANDRLAKIKEKGVIEVATEPYFAPYEFIDPTKTGDEQYVGADIELAKAIAEKLGVDLKIVPLDFAPLLAGIADGKYDLAISAISYSPSRAEAMNLSDIYKASNSTYGYICRAEDADKYTTIESVKDAVIITQSGSVQEALFNQYIGKDGCKELKLVSNMTDGYLAVAEGKADVCICSSASASLYAENNGGLVLPDFQFEVDPKMNGTVCAAPPEETDTLIAAVNEVIAELQKDDQLAKWFEEYAEYARELGIE